MRFCQPHWDEMRAAIRERGMDELVAKSGEELAQRLTEQVDEEVESLKNFDPLMQMNWAILNRLIEEGGPGSLLVLMAPNEDGSERCPLCFANKEHRSSCKEPECPAFDGWISSCADFMARRAVGLGWVREVN